MGRAAKQQITRMTTDQFYAWDGGGHDGKLELVDGVARVTEPAEGLARRVGDDQSRQQQAARDLPAPSRRATASRHAAVEVANSRIDPGSDISRNKRSSIFVGWVSGLFAA